MRDSLLLSQTSLFLVFRCKNSEILFLEPIYNGCETQIMKSLSTIFTLTFTVMFSSTSFAEWTKAGENANGIYYVDFERIRKHNGYVYYWELSDYPKPNKYGDLSYKSYNQGDCELFRYKILSDQYFKQPMGRGKVYLSSNTPDQEWHYARPNSAKEVILEKICSR